MVVAKESYAYIYKRKIYTVKQPPGTNPVPGGCFMMK